MQSRNVLSLLKCGLGVALDEGASLQSHFAEWNQLKSVLKYSWAFRGDILTIEQTKNCKK